MIARSRQHVLIRVAAIGCIAGALPPPSYADSAVQVAIPGESGQEPADLDDMRTWRDWLLDHGFAVDRCGHDPATGTMTIDGVTPEKLQELEEAGFTIVDTTIAGGGDVPPPDDKYLDPSEVEAALISIAAEHPDLVSLFSIGTTWEGRSIFAVEISDRPGEVEDEPAILFNGQHHARELVTSHIVMDIVRSLVEGYGFDDQITRWVQSYKTVCVPMVNPDGVQHVFDEFSMWRRNRRDYQDCLGVDLNRNYPYLWGPGCGSSGYCNDIFRGPSAASEIETRAMMTLVDHYRFVMATSYHSFGRFIDYPYACSTGLTSTLMPEHAVIDEMMHGVADAIYRVDNAHYTVYSPVPFGGVNGDDTSWYYAHRGIYSFIIEAGLQFAPPFYEVEGIVARNRGGWRYMYERLGQARIDVQVSDACNHEPLEAEVTLANFKYDTGEQARRTRLPFGRWTYLVLPDSRHTVRASRDGFLSREILVHVANEPKIVEILLEPVAGCQGNLIPTVSTWGLTVIALALLSVGTILVGRRRAA